MTVPEGFEALTQQLPENLWKGKHIVGAHPAGFWFVARLEAQYEDGGFRSLVVKSHLTEKEANEMCDLLGRFGTQETMN